MCQYLVDTYGGDQFKFKPSQPQYGTYLNFLHMADATLTFPQTLVLRYEHFEVGSRKQPQVVDDYSKWFLARLKAVDKALSQNKYLCSNDFTAADVSVGYALLLAKHLGLNAKFPPRIAEYYHDISNRPAFLRAMEVQHEAALSQGVPTIPAPDIRP
jgi:glutathione S-transferase